MITTKKELKRVLLLEKNNYGVKLPQIIAGYFKASELGMIWIYQKRLRKWEYHFNNSHKIRSLICKTMTNTLGYRIGFSMHPNCFDEGLKMFHIGKILANSNTRVGKNCVLHINTFFVATNGFDKAPTLGDNCKIGVGAILIGDIKLANGIAVGAGSVVTKSFDKENITIGGVPAKQISNKGLM